MAQLGNLNYQMASAVPYMSEEHQAVVRSGIGLFELRLPYKSSRDRVIFGPIGVKVTETSDRNLRSAFNREWLAKGSNFIKYAVDKKGNGVAFVPDDPWWRNRVYLIDSPNLNPVALHTNKGIINGTQVDIELAVLKQHLKHEKTIYEVVRDGKRIEFYNTEEEAKTAISDMQEMSLRTDKATGNVMTVANDKHKYSVLKSMVIDYKPEIEELIRKNKHLEFGWTSSDKFQQVIRPAVIADIKKAVAQQPVSTSAKDIATALIGMSEADKEAIRQALLGGKPQIDEVDLDSEGVHEQPVIVEPVQEPVKRKQGRPKTKKAPVEIS